jgi:hypothetical protein
MASCYFTAHQGLWLMGEHLASKKKRWLSLLQKTLYNLWLHFRQISGLDLSKGIGHRAIQ